MARSYSWREMAPDSPVWILSSSLPEKSGPGVPRRLRMPRPRASAFPLQAHSASIARWSPLTAAWIKSVMAWRVAAKRWVTGSGG
jgi:hypothetical protein